MITVILLTMCFASNLLLGEEMKFVEDRIKCSGNIVFQTKEVEQKFLYYQNSSGTDELDCAKKCFQKLQFCHAVRFDYVTKRCLYSYKIVGSCSSEQTSKTIVLPKKDVRSVIIHCIRCDGTTERVAQIAPISPKNIQEKKTKKLYNRLDYLELRSTKFPNEYDINSNNVQTDIDRQPIVSNLENNVKYSEYSSQQEFRNTLMNSNYYDILSSPTIELSTEIVTESEKLAIVISDQNDSPYGVTVAQTVKPLSLSLESTQVYRLLSKVDVQERIPRPQFKHILPVIKQKTEEKLVLNLQEPFSNSVDPQTRQKICNDDLLLPCINNTGRDCVITTSQKCPICICPLKSPARGCSGAQGLTPSGRLDLLLGRKKCPDGNNPQPVVRYMRSVDSSKNVDDCISTIQPYCGYLMDVKYWRMPRTKNECYYYCYTDSELKGRNIDISQLKD